MLITRTISHCMRLAAIQYKLTVQQLLRLHIFVAATHFRTSISTTTEKQLLSPKSHTARASVLKLHSRRRTIRKISFIEFCTARLCVWRPLLPLSLVTPHPIVGIRGHRCGGKEEDEVAHTQALASGSTFDVGCVVTPGFSRTHGNSPLTTTRPALG